ncbi:DUF4349 domain-containing protein [Jeongeupia chitinilytica]|uniref:DUF4349 domain-containing protein n=1 Tax=Jeongeupia chitinilytica TaxID=1041641 RepID=A0ABQ3GVB3_9NEIS|nr:DUF4349 domain-containing protein [Jeongeupia chitinilytica]GHD55092.1 hypothetical protein GCM10007350_00270 [Jeongeupia chitinilytica]
MRDEYHLFDSRSTQGQPGRERSRIFRHNDLEWAMRTFVMAMFLILAMTACSKKEEASAEGAVTSASGQGNGAARFMAYAHMVRLDVTEGKVAGLYESVQDACRKAVAEQCVILKSSLSTGRDVSAEIRLRATPAGIQKLMDLLANGGRIIDKSVSAEDLAGPIGDAARKLAMLEDYRAKLEALRARASSDVDALIKVNQALAQVQSDIEAVSGEKAHLMQRVETATLTVSIATMQSRSFWRPVALALSDFGRNLSQGVSSAITGVAYLLPWCVVLLVFFFLGRRLWRRQKRLPKSA